MKQSTPQCEFRLFNLGQDFIINDRSNNKVQNKFKITKIKNKRIKINKDKQKSSIKKLDKIFTIKKMMKLGRIKKDSNKRGKHDKFKRDNIIRRFRVHLMQSIYDYINNSFIINKKSIKYKQKILKQLSSNYIKSISKKDNINWFNSSIRNIFSQKITSKISRQDYDYNRRTISRIYEQNKEIDVINILDKTIREMWLVYINDDIERSNNGFATIKDDINKFKEKGETESYIKSYINVANNYENIFNGIISRK